MCGNAAVVLADWIERADPTVFHGRRPEALEGAVRLRNLAHGEALTIDFGDTADTTKRILVVPGEPINFGYRGKEDEAASRTLVERCASALDCDVVIF